MKNLVRFHLLAAVILTTATFAFAQTYSLVPDQVPKGAYVNGADGDQQYSQRIRYTIGTTWTDATGDPDLIIALPADITLADMDDDDVFNEEVTVWTNDADGAVTVKATTTGSQIDLNFTGGTPAAGEWYEFAFPIETDTSASGTANYTTTFTANTNETNGTITVTYATTPNNVTWDPSYADDDDQSSTLGDVYPAALDNFLSGDPVADGIDLIWDGAAAITAGVVYWGAALDNTNDNGEVQTFIWASQTPGLSRINNQNAHRPWDNAATPTRPYGEDGAETVGASTATLLVGPGDTGPTYQVDGTLLAEGYWFFYLTSDATSEWVVGASDTVEIRHWPTFNTTNPDDASGFDYGGTAVTDNPDGDYDKGAAAADDVLDVYLESGGTLGKDGNLPTATTINLNTLDFFWDFQDLDDNAVLDIFLSTQDDLTATDLTITGDQGSEVVTAIGTSSRKITPSSIEEESSTGFFTYDIYTDAATYEPAGDYYVYSVINDGKNQSVYQFFAFAGVDGADEKMVHVKHYPYFKFDAVYVDAAGVPEDGVGSHLINSNVDDYYVISWGQTPASGLGDGDLDADDNATITFYYSTTAAFDLDDIIALAVPTTVLDGALLTDINWTNNVTLIGSTTEDPDTKADNRYMWDFSAESPAITDGAIVNIIAHIQGGSDHLFVQLTTTLGPLAIGGVFDDYSAVFNHGSYFRAETPLAGETIVVEGGDELVFKWSGYDRDDATGGVVEAIIVPTGVAITAGGYADDTYGTLDGGGAGGADIYWLFTTATGQTNTDLAPNTTGPTLSSGSYTLDVSKLTTDQAGNVAAPSGFYDVYYYWTADRTGGILAGDSPIQAPGVLRFLGSSAAATNFQVTPNKTTLSKGETVTITVEASSPSTNNVNILALALDVPSTYFTVVDQGGGEPFINEEVNFDGSAVLMNSMTNSGGYWQLDFVEVQTTPAQTLNGGPFAVASFQITVNSSGSGTEFIDNDLVFVNTATRTSGIVDANGNPEVVTLADPAAALLLAPPGTIEGQIELEVLPDPGQTVDIHVLPLGSFTPISDADFLAANGGANADGSITVTLGTDGAYSVTSIPTGDYDILAHKDYHLDQLEQNVAVRPVTTTTVDFQAGDMLLAGDIAGWDDDTDASTASLPDNHIDTQDINAVANAFGSVPGGATWNEAADFNNDDYVYISDYNVVTTNNTVQGEGLIFKGVYDANNNVVARLLALSQAGDEYTFAVQAENLSSLHAYAVEMSINSKHWELLSYADGMADFYRSAELHKAGDFNTTFASGILGRSAISAKEMTLVTMTLKAKVSDPEEISISGVSLIDGNGDLSEAIMGSSTSLPTEYALSQNYPNPFNPTTNISFSLPVEGQVKLAVYNLLGQEITTLASGMMDAGMYKAVWNGLDNSGRSVSTGMYFYRLMVDNRVVDTKKMLFLK